jgi:peptide/nickel transport system permease protein
VAGVAVKLNWLPVSGMQGPLSLILPALTLGTGLAMVLARFLAESLERVLASEPLRTATAKGASPWRCLARHAAPLAAGPVVQIIFLQVGMVLTGAVLTEAVFGWPGLGTLLVEALHQRDYPVLQGCLLFISLTYIICLWLSDWAMAWLDPRVTHATTP